MNELISKFKQNDRACFCAAALVLSNLLSIFTTAAGFQQLLQSLGLGLLLSIVTQAFKLLCEWRVSRGPGTRMKGSGTSAKAWCGFMIVLVGYLLSITFSVFFSEVQFLSHAYPDQKWTAIVDASLTKGFSEQVQALTDEVDAEKETLQTSIAESLDAIEQNISAQPADPALTPAQADAMLSKYVPVYAADNITVLFDPDSDHWTARLKNIAAALAAGEDTDDLDSCISELENDISGLDNELNALMAQISTAAPASIKASRGNKSTQDALDEYVNVSAAASTAVAQQLLNSLNTKNAVRSQYQCIRSDLEVLRDAQKRTQSTPAAQLETAKKACRKALLTVPDSLESSIRAFVEAAADLGSGQTENFTALRMDADLYVNLTELEDYCSHARTAALPEDRAAAVRELREKTAQLPDSAKRKSILHALDKLTSTYLSPLNPLDRSAALLTAVPGEYRTAAYGCLLVAILIDALSLIANLSWPKEDETVL